MRTKVLVTCLANRYRSPLAAVFLSRYPHIDTRSAGFKPGGLKAGKPVRDVAKRLGFDLEDHRSTQLVASHGDWADIIIAMSPTHLEKLSHMFGASTHIKLLGDFLEPRVGSIPDLGFISPGMPEFPRVVGMIKEATGNLAEWLKTKSISLKK